MSSSTLASLLGLLTLGAVVHADEYRDPHNDPTACDACHGVQGGQVVSTHPITETCRSCHPTADMHPVGVAPKEIVVPGNFPLEDGKLGCATCHVQPVHGGAVADAPRPYFRGGTFEPLTEFCYQCHERQEYTRTNPHQPGVAPDPGSPTCAACHTAPPSAGAPPEQSNLRTSPDANCKVCHEGTVHGGVEGHVGMPLDDAAWLRLSGRLPTLGREVACFSCHDVHEGVASGRTVTKTTRRLWQVGLGHDWSHLLDDEGVEVVWPGEKPGDAKVMLALPLEGNALCAACHGEGP